MNIIIIIITVNTDRDAVVDGIFLAVHVHFRFVDISAFATNLRFAFHCFLQTNMYFHIYDTHTGLLMWYKLTARGIILYAH